MKNKNNKVVRICYIAAFTAIICVISLLPGIPLPGGVPMTLQTLIIPMAGIILGPADGFIATLIYVLLGAVGLPVFSGFTGGLGVIMGATGGFIISFPVLSLISGLGVFVRKPSIGRYVALYGFLLLGAVVNYLVGTIWFATVYMGAVTAETMATGFTACVLPFIPTSIIKIILSGVLGLAIRKALIKANLLTH